MPAKINPVIPLLGRRVDKTLSKGLAVLETLAQSPSPIGISELAAILGLTKSNVHRLLLTLRAAGYVTQEAERSYRCTLKIWELGNTVIKEIDLPRIGARAMRDLAKASGESVHLTVLDGTRALYVEKLESEHPVRAYTRVGDQAPLHCTATGKILLSFSYDVLRETIVQNLLAYTRKTITTVSMLDREVERVKNSNIAFNFGEFREDVGGVAAPIRDPLRGIMAAIGISGPLSRLTKQRMRQLAPSVRDAGIRISQELTGLTVATNDDGDRPFAKRKRLRV
jgi:IclR family KDG regulon transcriptional repressor